MWIGNRSSPILIPQSTLWSNFKIICQGLKTTQLTRVIRKSPDFKAPTTWLPCSVPSFTLTQGHERAPSHMIIPCAVPSCARWRTEIRARAFHRFHLKPADPKGNGDKEMIETWRILCQISPILKQAQWFGGFFSCCKMHFNKGQKHEFIYSFSV